MNSSLKKPGFWQIYFHCCKQMSFCRRLPKKESIYAVPRSHKGQKFFWLVHHSLSNFLYTSIIIDCGHFLQKTICIIFCFCLKESYLWLLDQVWFLNWELSIHYIVNDLHLLLFDNIFRVVCEWWYLVFHLISIFKWLTTIGLDLAGKKTQVHLNHVHCGTKVQIIL